MPWAKGNPKLSMFNMLVCLRIQLQLTTQNTTTRKYKFPKRVLNLNLSPSKATMIGNGVCQKEEWTTDILV